MAFKSVSLKNSVVKFLDGTTPTAKSVTVNIGDGNISWSESRELEYLKDRGTLDAVEESEENPISVDLGFRWTDFRSDPSGTVTPYDAVTGTGATITDSWTTSDTLDPCGPLAIDIEITFTPTCVAEPTEVYTLKAFRYEDISPDMGAKQLSVTGSCNTRHVSIARI